MQGGDLVELTSPTWHTPSGRIGVVLKLGARGASCWIEVLIDGEVKVFHRTFLRVIG